MKIHFQFTAIIVFACALLGACDRENIYNNAPKAHFEYTGLTGHIVTQITAYDHDEPLFAATNKGIYVLDNDEDEWQLRSPSTWPVNTVELLSQSHILASVTIDGEHKLMESLNSGLEWNEVSSDFGVVDASSNPEQIRNMLFEEDTGTLYAVGLNVLAQSDDFGREWTPVHGDWQGFASGLSALVRHPETNDFWIGGQGAIENPVLRQIDGTTVETTDHSEAVADLLEVPSVVKAIRFFSDDEERIIVSGEGGIIQSKNYGETWQALRVNNNSRFYFDVLTDPEDSDVLFTAGWDKNFDDPQELRVELSQDGGVNWRVYKYKDPQLRGGVWSMHLREEGNNTVIYLGLCNGGVFRVDFR